MIISSSYTNNKRNNITVTHLAVPHLPCFCCYHYFDVICNLSLDRQTATWNLFVKQRTKEGTSSPNNNSLKIGDFMSLKHVLRNFKQQRFGKIGNAVVPTAVSLAVLCSSAWNNIKCLKSYRYFSECSSDLSKVRNFLNRNLEVVKRGTLRRIYSLSPSTPNKCIAVTASGEKRKFSMECWWKNNGNWKGKENS